MFLVQETLISGLNGGQNVILQTYICVILPILIKHTFVIILVWHWLLCSGQIPLGSKAVLHHAWPQQSGKCFEA